MWQCQLEDSSSPPTFTSTGSIGLKDGLVPALNIHSFQHTDVLHIETRRQGSWMIFDRDIRFAEFNINISYD